MFQLLSKILDVIDVTQTGLNLLKMLFCKANMTFYVGDYKHSALLCTDALGMLLQRVNDASYVQHKLNLMYNHANFTDDEQNRVGLAKAMGMVPTLCAMPCIFLHISRKG